MTFRHNLYKLREEREMKPVTFLNAVCSLLYEKRYEVELFLSNTYMLSVHVVRNGSWCGSVWLI